MASLRKIMKIGVYPPKNWLARLYRLQKKTSKSGINSIIRSFLGDGLSDSQLRWYRLKMKWAYVWHQWNESEYFHFGYERLSREGRKKYVTELEKDLFCRKYNQSKTHRIFNNKGLTYQYFAPYYKRDVCIVNKAEVDMSELADFLSKHTDVIVKPICESMGNGIRIIRNASVEAIAPIVEKTTDGLIVEELICQSSALSVFHPKSVNTVRIPTWVVDDKINVLPSFIRFGCGGAEVDNAAKGGLFGFIDLESGIVTGVCDKRGRPQVTHPDSHLSIVGLSIPHWDECVSLAKELAKVVPDAKYVGWDLAFTDNGWALVEGNVYGQFVCQQLSSRKGIRDFLLAIDPHCFDFE